MNYTHKIILFSEENYKGKALVAFGKLDCLHRQLHIWNDVAKSLIVVEGRWMIATNCTGDDISQPNLSKEVWHGDGQEYRVLGSDWANSISALIPL